MNVRPQGFDDGDLLIREIDASSSQEIELVAHRMRATLVEVEGEANTNRLHSPEWIRERLVWHVSSSDVLAKVLVAAFDTKGVIGHTLLRRELDEAGAYFGLFATTYVLPTYRRSGVARRLLQAGEQWFMSIGLRVFSTWTSAINIKLIKLYEGHGYRITESGNNEVTETPMVKLSKTIHPVRSAA